MSALLEAVRERARRDPSPGAPWSPDQLARVIVGNTVGAVLVAVGWYQCATTGEVVRSRLTWLSVSVAGLAVAGLANGLWMAAIRARVAVGRDVAHGEVARLVPSVLPAGADVADVVVSGAGMTRYHRPACELAGQGDQGPVRPAAPHGAPAGV